LISYDQLSESDREYDRQTALATLRTITSLGYTVKKIPNKI
jgi:hypothetical protein